MPAPLTNQLRSRPPMLHGAGDQYFGLAWDALAWLEQALTPGLRTLETGTGSSTIVFAASGASHLAISPAAAEHERIRRYCDEHGISTEKVHFIAAPSHEVLVEAREDGPLDLVLIDGAHGFPYAVLDWFYTAPRIPVGGRLLVDDAQLAPVNGLVKDLRSNPAWRLDVVLGSRTASFTKLDDAEPSFGIDYPSRMSFDYLPWHRRASAWLRLSFLQHPSVAPIVQRYAAHRRR